MPEKVSETGMFGALGLTMVATLGHFLTQHRADTRLDVLWIVLFALSLLTLSGAAVNFDPKRLLK